MLCRALQKMLTSALQQLALISLFCLSPLGFAFDHTDSSNTASLTPTQLMDNEQLFLSAEAMRDDSLSPAQQNANRLWLSNYRKVHLNGFAAVRKLMQLSIDKFNPLKGRSENTAAASNKDNPALFDINNYALSLGPDEVELKFSYHFN
ncbi:hypothetical protein [Agaribacterium haliotis]|uniref:hypothetical protein n=1 Tax=Agaribacterium haliotis TaxID=2013869 RepID=UPI001178C46B|nr:hypothetical protein [Agaribacterium haliotis]